MTMSPPERRANPGISPLLSSRAELAGRLATPEDDYALIVAVLLRHAAAAPGSARSKRSVSVACRSVKRMMTPAELKEGAAFDEPGRLTPERLLRGAADHIARVLGKVALASNILESLSVLVPPDSVAQIRISSPTFQFASGTPCS